MPRKSHEAVCPEVRVACNLRRAAADKVKRLACLAAEMCSESAGLGIVHNAYERWWARCLQIVANPKFQGINDKDRASSSARSC
jgi:hypothetical protein